MKINLLLFFASLPYVAVTVYDTWMHQHDRSVPQVERWLHGGILVFVTLFMATAILEYENWAWVCLVLCFPLMVIDEVGYHQHLHFKEKKVHYLAGFCFISFIGIWLWTT